MRSTNSIKNAMVTTIMNLITILIGFVAQKIFIQTLGTEYLGVNGLFTNIVSMLGIVELGLGSAIIYHLYKPIADGNKEEVKSLMLFYRISYRVIAILITIIGLCIIPFLRYIVGEVNIHENIVYIYILFLIDVIASYLLTYKRSILYANQKTYIINLIHIGYLLFMNITQLLILKFTHNYILYLWIKIIFRLIENVIVTLVSDKMYPYIKENNIKPIDKENKKNIFTKMKGLIYHKIATFIVFGTDNIIISTFLGVTIVGLYSNYNLIIQALNNFISQVFSSITASIGNLLTEDDEKKSYYIYKNMLFLNSWLFTFSSAGVLCIIEPFIKIWIGEQFILPFSVLVVLVINFYMQGMRKTSNTFKEAAGIFYEDRYVPIFESLINIIASIIFVKIFGLIGVFIGTITSTSIVFFYSYPIFVYKPLFKRTYFQYLKDYILYIVTAVISIIFTYIIVSKIIVQNTIIQIIINLCIVIIVPNLIHLIVFFKSNEFKYYISMVNNILNKKRKYKQ